MSQTENIVYRIRQSPCACGCVVFQIEKKTRICVLCREKGRDDAD